MAGPVRTQQSIDVQIAHLERELLELKRQRNELSPVSGIPPEILCQILLLATSYSFHEDVMSFVSVPERLRVEQCTEILLHVSHSWRSAALGCPQLWAEIDVGINTDSRQFDFMVKHAHPCPIALLVKTPHVMPSAHQSSLPKCHATVKQILSRGENVEKLALDGPIHHLLDLLQVTQPGTLQTLQLAVSNGAIIGYAAAGASIANLPLFMLGPSALRTLTLEGCAIPLTTPIVIRSPNLTSLSLSIRAGDLVSHILGVFKNLPQLQQLNLDFQGPLQTSQVIGNPVPLPFLSQVALRGDLHSLTATLTCLQMSAMAVDVVLFCQTEDQTNLAQAGLDLFKAVGQARCASERVCPKLPFGQLFAPHTLRIAIPYLSPLLKEGSYLVIGNWMQPHGHATGPPRLEVFAAFINRGQVPPIDWNPLLLVHHPKDLRQLTGWSMDELHTFEFQDDWDYPDSLWQFLSECPKISHLTIYGSHALKFLPLISTDNGIFPFPTLSCIEVRGEASTTGHSSVGQGFDSLLEAFLPALRGRQTLSSKYGVQGAWALDELRLEDFPDPPNPHLVDTAHAQGLIRWVDCRYEEEEHK